MGNRKRKRKRIEERCTGTSHNLIQDDIARDGQFYYVITQIAESMPRANLEVGPLGYDGSKVSRFNGFKKQKQISRGRHFG